MKTRFSRSFLALLCFAIFCSNKIQAKQLPGPHLQAVQANVDTPVTNPLTNTHTNPTNKTKTTEKTPTQASLLEASAKSYSTGNMDASKATLKQCLTIYPACDTAMFNLAVIYERQADLQNALAFYKEALNVDPAVKDYKDAVDSVQRRLTEVQANEYRAKQAEAFMQAQASVGQKQYLTPHQQENPSSGNKSALRIGAQILERAAPFGLGCPLCELLNMGH